MCYCLHDYIFMPTAFAEIFEQGLFRDNDTLTEGQDKLLNGDHHSADKRHFYAVKVKATLL